MLSQICTSVLEIAETVENLKRIRTEMEQAGIDELQSLDVVITLLEKAHERYEIEFLEEGYSQHLS